MKIKKRINEIHQKTNMHFLVITVFIINIFIFMSFQSKYFLTITILDVMVNNFNMEAIMALVIISRGSDISISEVLPFVVIIFENLLLMNFQILLAVLISIIVAGIIGFFNNELRRILKTHPTYVMMARQLTLMGLNLAITNGSEIWNL